MDDINKTTDEITKLLKNISISSEDKVKYLIDFNKTILLMLSTVLSVIIALFNNNSRNDDLGCIFILTILLFALSIFFGVIYLYGFFVQKLNKQNYLGNATVNKIDGKNTEPEINKFPKRYMIFGYIFHIFSGLSLMMLVLYSIVKAI